LCFLDEIAAGDPEIDGPLGTQRWNVIRSKKRYLGWDAADSGEQGTILAAKIQPCLQKQFRGQFT
jgi:hypothetical protein